MWQVIAVQTSSVQICFYDLFNIISHLLLVACEGCNLLVLCVSFCNNSAISFRLKPKAVAIKSQAHISLSPLFNFSVHLCGRVCWHKNTPRLPK